MKRQQKKPYKIIFNAMGSIHVKNVTIVNFTTVIILHLIAMKIAVRMTSMKDSSLGRNTCLTTSAASRGMKRYGNWLNMQRKKTVKERRK